MDGAPVQTNSNADVSCDLPDSKTNPSDFANSICEIVGYAAATSWLTYFIIQKATSSSVVAPPAGANGGAYTLISAVAPIVLCLILCIVFGMCIALASDKLQSSRAFESFWCIGAACAVVSFFMQDDLAVTICLALSYSCARLLWKTDLLNKSLSVSGLINAACAGCVILVASTLLDSGIAQLLPSMLLCASFLCLLPLMSHMLSNRPTVERAKMKAAPRSSASKWKPIASHFVAGIAYGLLACTCTMNQAAVSMGIAWLVGYSISTYLHRSEREFTRSGIYGAQTLGVLSCLWAISSLPRFWWAAVLSLLIALVVSDSLINVLRHASVKRDETLSDIYLFGTRHASNSAAVCVGFTAAYCIFVLYVPPSLATNALLGIAALAYSFVSFMALGVFSKKKAKKREGCLHSQAVDPWHAKVLAVSKANELTDRQTEILEALSRGRNTKYIMGRLYLSEGTVKKQSYLIYKRLDVHNQQDLITLVMNADTDCANSDGKKEAPKDLLSSFKADTSETA